MDINPLSLLEVTMGGDPVENEEDDDDCIILDPPIETLIVDDTPDPNSPLAEPEITSKAGYHFLEQNDTLQDPLSLPSAEATSSNSDNIPFFWVSSSIANLSNVSSAEREFRKMHYKDIHNVLQDRLHCTICQEHIGCDIRVHSKSIEHPVLKVLVCEKCATNYKNLQFTLNDKGKETRCRWCGKSPMGGGAPLRRCQQCPFSFCQNCLSRNLPNSQPKGIWTCCVCNMKQLWPARSLLWALQTLKERFLSRPSSSSNFGADGDIAFCCKGKFKKKYIPRILAPAPQTTGEMTNTAPTKFLTNGSPLVKPKFYKLTELPNKNLVKGGPKLKLVKIPNLMQSPSTSYSISHPASQPIVQPIVSQPNSSSFFPPPSLRLKKLAVKPRRPPTPMPKEPPVSYKPIIAEHPPSSVLEFPPSPIPEPPETSNCTDDRISTAWLKNKINSYTKDLAKLSSRLASISDDMPSVDSVKNVQTKMEAISTLLSLNSSLLKDSGNNLRNEWKERKVRHVIGKLQPPSNREELMEDEQSEEDPAETQEKPTTRKTYDGPRFRNNTPSYPVLREALVRVKPEPMQSLKKPKIRKKPKRLTLKKGNSKKKHSQSAAVISENMLNDLKREFHIRECFVPIEKVSLPYSQQEIMHSVIKLERF